MSLKSSSKSFWITFPKVVQLISHTSKKKVKLDLKNVTKLKAITQSSSYKSSLKCNVAIKWLDKNKYSALQLHTRTEMRSSTGFVLHKMMMMMRRSVQFWAVTGSEECRLRRTKFGNTVSFLNVTPVISCFCPPPANILLSASLWVGTRSSGRQIFPLRRWRWTDCWLLPVRHWTCYSLLTHDFGAKKAINQMVAV